MRCSTCLNEARKGKSFCRPCGRVVALTPSGQACLRKVAYTQEEAKHESFIRNFYKYRRGGYYKCPYGDHWHLTKRKGAK